MSPVRSDLPHRERSPARSIDGCWKQHSVRDLEQASQAADTVLLALQEAGYAQRDIDGMRIALDEAIANALLSRGWQRPQSSQLAVRYRVNESYAAVEVESHPVNSKSRSNDRLRGLGISRPSPETSLPSILSFMTWIRYSRRDHSATLCQCSLLK
jgi:hypothetical protein